MTFFGPDGSHHQDGMTPDWNDLDFLIWRSSIGKRIDRTFNQFNNEARARDIPFCAYHFVYTLNNYPADLQADTCAQSVNNTDTPIMLDWESDGSISPGFDAVLAVANELRELGYRVPLLYTGQWYWAQKGRPTLEGHGLDLVNSNYGNQKPTGTYTAEARYKELGGDTSTRWEVSYGGLKPSIWQFGSRIKWGDRYMDMNAIRVGNLSQWFRVPVVAPPVPQPIGGNNVMLPMIAKYPNNGAWVYSLDGGITHRHVGGPRAASLVAGGAIDVLTNQVVNSWSTVQPCSSESQLRSYLGTRVS